MHACLATSYDARLWDVAVAALFRTPEAALTELARHCINDLVVLVGNLAKIRRA